MKSRHILLIILTILLCIPWFSSQAETRVALVIGNSDYQHTTTLKNPANDATAIADALKRLEFKVFQGFDLDRLALDDLLYEFGNEAEQSDVALIYYAGHGIQVDGQNYLIPIDAKLERERSLRRLLSLDDLIAEAGLAKQLGLVILDSCRDNPLATTLARSMGTSRSTAIGQGLARVQSTPTNTLVAFATEADAVAADGEGQHSPYT